MWLSVDPMSSERPSLTPYNFVSNNPIMRVDPTGMVVDDIYLNAQGEVTKVVENDQPNRFFDENGNELKFHDDGEGGVDNFLLSAHFIIGEKLYNTSTIKDYVGALEEAGIKNDRGAISTAIKSHGAAGFAEGHLAQTYDVPHYESDSFWVNYNSQAGYFKFEGSDKIYNLYDGGNHMWGTWMRLNGWSLQDALSGANANEFRDDSPADQAAILNGWNYGTFNPYNK